MIHIREGMKYPELLPEEQRIPTAVTPAHGWDPEAAAAYYKENGIPKDVKRAWFCTCTIWIL